MLNEGSPVTELKKADLNKIKKLEEALAKLKSGEENYYLNPASPKNQALSRVICPRIPLIQSLLARSVSTELGFLTDIYPGLPKMMGVW